jgi:phosphatidate cytidylyltransferase
MNNLHKRIFSSLLLLPTLLYFIYLGSYYTIFLTIFCFLIACYEWYKIAKNNFFLFLGLFFLFFSFFTFYQISLNLFLMFFVLLICISTDLGGYFFGKMFKGPKLIKKISPQKTYSGMIGSFFLSFIALLLIYKYIDGIDLIKNYFVLTIIISTFSQIGDLIVSYFKRLSKIKDTGKIIPGHGGILDRIDGMIFVFPTVYLIKLNGFL